MTQTKKLKKTTRAASAARPPAAKATAAPAKAGSPRGAVGEAAIRRTTGHGLDHWFAVLDALAPKATGHTDRARYLYEAYAVPGWHAQGIAVAYERARGLRAFNQACDGSFQVSVSRAMPVGVAEVASAIGGARRRAQWLKSADPALVRAVEAAFSGEKPRSVKIKDALNANIRIPWDGATVEIRITGKPAGTTTVVADTSNLKQEALVEERRAQWKRALDALKAHLCG